MLKTTLFAAALFVGSTTLAHAAGPNDAQIAHIAYTAGQIDIAAAVQAKARSKNEAVLQFANEMARDHKAVNDQALALVAKLKVTPEDNDVSKSLSRDAAATLEKLKGLDGAEFDKAYLANEVAYHKAVNAALQDTLIPSAQNAELKALLQTGLALFQEHEMHAEHAAAAVK